MKLAIVGATGLVGNTILKVLEERQFPFTELYLVASHKSVGQKVEFKNKTYTVISAQECINLKPNIAIFSAGGNTSLELAPLFEQVGCYVIDNSSAWRMDPDKLLVVPEINGHLLNPNQKIIANPNCSTIQLVMVLNPLHKINKIKRVIVSTYQSVTGTGKKAVDQLMAERAGDEPAEMAYKYQIDLNAIPQIDVFLENGYTKEEMKMTNETKKIMGDNSIEVSATAVRIPVMGGHSESVNIEFESPMDIDVLKQELKNSQGIVIQDDIKNQIYPMPLTSNQKDEVFVGRIRLDFSNPNAVNMWIVSDNLRKGAATNAIQIAEYLVNHKLVN